MADEPINVDPAYADWRKLPPSEQAKAWERIRPGTFSEIWAEAVADGSHRRQLDIDDARHRRKLEEEAAIHDRRLDWFMQTIQLMRVLGASGALLALVYTAVYFVDHHAPTQGASVLGIGGVTLVGLFLGSNPDRLSVLVKRKSAQIDQ